MEDNTRVVSSKVVEVQIGEAVITMATMKLSKYFEVMKLHKANKDDILLTQNLILHSIRSWTIKDADGNVVDVNTKNLLDYVNLDCLSALDKVATEVNNLGPEEKNS